MDAAKYAELFVTESREHLQRCDALLLALERDAAAPDAVPGLFRALHTIKGMAATMGYAGVADLAHRAETLLDAVRQGRVAVTAPVVDVLFRAVDAVRAGVEAAAVGRPADADVVVLAALERLALAEASARPGSVPDVPGPSAAEVRAAGLRLVEVRLDAGSPLKGARATLVLRRAEQLGAVSAARPAPADLLAEGFDGRLAFRFLGAPTDAELEAALAGVGDVEAVAVRPVDGAAGPVVREERRIRLPLAMLDRMVDLAGELSVTRHRLELLARPVADEALRATVDRLGQLVAALQAEVIAARLTPVGEVFERFPRLVRDVARELGRQVRLEVEGADIELDRAVLDEIGDPLVHLLRNAIDHGIEPPADRAALGKPAEGRLVLSAVRERATVAIRVRDDGRGIDRARVLGRARRDGLVAPDAETLADDALLALLARPGFSTADRVSEVSGRGVGIDVVATRLRRLGGSVELATAPGEGTTWTLRVPLTLAVVRALLAGVGDERYVLPVAYVAETLVVDPGDLGGDRATLATRDGAARVRDLREVLGVPGTPAPGRRPAVVLRVGERLGAVVVDRLLGQQEVVVEAFDPPAGMPPVVGGATILADGDPALILDAAALV